MIFSLSQNSLYYLVFFFGLSFGACGSLPGVGGCCFFLHEHWNPFALFGSLIERNLIPSQWIGDSLDEDLMSKKFLCWGLHACTSTITRGRHLGKIASTD